MTAILSLVAGIAICTVSVATLLLFVVVHIFITFACPAWLIKLQDYKEFV